MIKKIFDRFENIWHNLMLMRYESELKDLQEHLEKMLLRKRHIIRRLENLAELLYSDDDDDDITGEIDLEINKA